MNSNFSIKSHFQEENDFFLSYINEKMKELDNQISVLDLEEEKGGFPEETDKFLLLNRKLFLINNRKEFEHMKDHYHLALNHGRSAPLGASFLIKKNKKQEKDIFSEEQKFHLDYEKPSNSQNKMKNPLNLEVNNDGFPKPLLLTILNLIHVAKSLKALKSQDEFLNYLYNNNMKVEELNEIITFYKSCFSKSSNKNFLTYEAKLHFCSNMLEIYCNEKHALHNHFRSIRQKIETIAKSPIFLLENPNQNLSTNLNTIKNDLHNQSGSQSDDARRVIKKNFQRNKNNLENYDGDSEKSIHKSEREEVKEENEEDFNEDKAKSDGESNPNIEFEQLFNKRKFKTINNNSKAKLHKLKKNKKLKKMFDDSGDHATGSASERNNEDSKTKVFSWGIRGLQKINYKNNKPPKGFDTDKDMKL